MDVVERFLALLSHPPRAVLALDYDGTLAPFREDRQTAYPYAAVPALLRGIVDGTDTRLVLVSGRPVAEVQTLLGLDRAPEIWGCHGWEVRSAAGRLTRHPLPPGASAALDRAAAAVAAAGWAARSERKHASVAVHWRAESDRACAAAAARALLAPLATRELELLDFAAGLELRCPAWDKGRALASVLADEPDDAPAAYLGDDRTDEDAFRVLAGRPRSLPILIGGDPRATAARVRLEPPADLERFLADWRRAAARRCV
ncbi:MAG: trehalose-phosphatase [Candidatus Krumholzibacteriia bacterium]